MGERDYRQLIIWQRADGLAKQVYDLSLGFPASEKFGLVSQLNRASLAVPTNIVEGFYRGRKEFSQFLVIAIASLKETEYLLEFATERGYLSQEKSQSIVNEIDEIYRMMVVFKKSLTRLPANPLTR